MEYFRYEYAVNPRRAQVANERKVWCSREAWRSRCGIDDETKNTINPSLMIIVRQRRCLPACLLVWKRGERMDSDLKRRVSRVCPSHFYRSSDDERFALLSHDASGVVLLFVLHSAFTLVATCVHMSPSSSSASETFFCACACTCNWLLGERERQSIWIYLSNWPLVASDLADRPNSLF